MRRTGGTRICLIHWNAAEARERAARLRAAGFTVTHDPIPDGALRALRDDPPDLIVIDLSRIPSQGRDVALAIRQYRQTREIPLVFVGGDGEKLAKVRALLPDATYATWETIRAAVREALRRPVARPAAAPSRMAGYAGAPLMRKLGIKEGAALVLVDPPRDVKEVLGELPDRVRLVRRLTAPNDLILWFVRTRHDLDRRMGQVVPRVGAGGIWICWPKRTSVLAGDLTQVHVRAAGLASGIVDYKICAIDATWSGLKFARRRIPPPGPDRPRSARRAH